MKDIVEIRWHGRGGQGAKTASLLLADAAFNTGKYVQGFPEYGPERMGAPITAYNRISSERSTVHSNIYFPDYVVVVDETLLSAVVSTVLRSVAYAVVYLVSFLLLLLLLRLLLAPLHLFTKLPVVHGINAVMGGALGLVKGALLLFFAVWLLRRLQIWITPELISQTYILRFFAEHSPMELITSL